MRRFLIAMVALMLSYAPANAQQLIGTYYAMLGPNEFYNSSGVRLGDFGAILQQDRANVHRFGIYDELDQGDPVFTTYEQRSRIPSIWRRGSGAQGVIQQISNGGSAYIYVEIYGYGTNASYIVVHQGAG